MVVTELVNVVIVYKANFGNNEEGLELLNTILSVLTLYFSFLLLTLLEVVPSKWPIFLLPISLFLPFLLFVIQFLTIGIKALFLVIVAETRSTTYINESIASLRTITDHHAHSLQEITQQLNAISVAL